MKLFAFTKEESIWVIIILSSLFIVSFFNYRIAERKARDSQRKSDLRTISNALEAFYVEFGLFPKSAESKILACNAAIDQEGNWHFEPCIWGKDIIFSINLPIEPQSAQGASYNYQSNQKRYQLYASLEGNDEDEYNPKIEERNLNCGASVCNFGLSSFDIPLDKSIEEYENEERIKL